MRLTALLLLAGFLQVSATGYSQNTKFNLDLKNQSVRAVLLEIEKNSTYRFFYSENLLNLDETISLSVKNKEIAEVLNTLFSNKPITFELMDNNLIALRPMPTQQQKSVSGKVTDSKNEPLPGVSIVVKGTTTGTITDFDGRFTLQLPANAQTLVFSFVGMKPQEIAIGSQLVFNVLLQEETFGIEEVVAVGYGVQKKSDITGSVASVGRQRLDEVPQMNIAQAIQGSVAGLRINQNSSNAEQTNQTIIIRGQNSIKASNTPLIILDGIPYAGNLSDINVNDIASIEILKDASSAAIYGARGANGVILISTIKGRSGKAVLNYDGYYGWDDIANMVDLMDPYEFHAFKLERVGDVFTDKEREQWAKGQFYNWIDEATRIGIQQQHTLSFSGGTEFTTYYVSGTYLDVKGIARNDDFKRVTLRFNLEEKLRDWLIIGTNTQISHSDRSGIPANFEQAFYMNPLIPPYQDDGKTLVIVPNPMDPTIANPLEGFNRINNDATRRVLTNNYIHVDVPFIKGLSYNLNTGYSYRFNDIGNFNGSNTKSGYERKGTAETVNLINSEWVVENILKYQKAFGKHNLDFTGLYSWQRDVYDRESVYSEGFPTETLTYYQHQVGTVITPNSQYSESSYISQMARLNYNYDSRYLITLTGRRDGYSGFGLDTKYGVFPSVAVGWNIANENFMKGMDAISSLKLRASYGQNGNQAVAPYQTLATLSGENYLDASYATAPGYYPSALGNPSLGWESTTSLNAGLDFGILANRITGSIDTYWSNTTDLLLDRVISPVHGVSSIAQNIGKTKNKGVEMMVSGTPLNRDGFKWNVDFNISYNQNEIVDLYGNGQDDLSNNWFLGKPIRMNFAYVFDGVWQLTDDIANSHMPTAKPGDAKIKDISGPDGVPDNKISVDDRDFIGSPIPKYLTGLTNTMTYKNFTLSFFMHAVLGATRQNPLLETGITWIEVRRNTINLDYWSPDNPINTYPANREDANPFGVNFYQKTDFLRLKDVTLAYRFDDKLTNKLGVKNLRAYVTAKNLATFTGWTGLDPELDGQRAVPLTRSILCGINFSF